MKRFLYFWNKEYYRNLKPAMPRYVKIAKHQRVILYGKIGGFFWLALLS